MLYLNEDLILQIGIQWDKCRDTIEETIHCNSNGNTVQPIKPYLRFGNLKNRIIAMPAYVGEKINSAGIKWIASFPENITKGIPRASSVTILNNTETGQIESIINTSLLSVIRTISVSSVMIKYYLEARKKNTLVVGIIGLGPIGQYHIKMCEELYGESISKIIIFDSNQILTSSLASINQKVIRGDTWEEAYDNSDIVITCTASSNRYINKKPKAGSLLLNVSLRDYTSDIYDYVRNSIVVDNWEEVCRENTDIEMFYKEKHLKQSEVKTLNDVINKDAIKSFKQNDSIMFNPMGMAIFDISIAKHYFETAKRKNIGINLS